ncbi:hypothetical protein C8R44DRAFT_813830 [Mycena epipterygia]|nr:hypothetical protein C8R44DRAFT_813830 [Mycena epipterygia]
MKSSTTIYLVLSALALPGAHAVTLVQPIPTSISSVSIPSFSVPSGFSIPSLSIPSQSISIPSLSIPTIPSQSLLSVPTSSVSFTAFFAVSIGGIASADGATTYFVEEIQGINGATKTLTAEAIVQGATVWRDDALHETCSLDGKGGAVCTEVVGEFTTAFTGTAFPIFTVGAGAAGAGGGNGGSGASNGAGGGSNGGGAKSRAAKVNVEWMLVGTVAAVVAGMSLVL